MTADDDLNDRQLCALDAMWRAQRFDGVDDEAAAEVEGLVRDGRLGLAYKRLAQARRRAAAAVASGRHDLS